MAAVDTVNRSNPSLPALKPDAPASAPAPAAAPEAKAAADGFDSAPELRRSSPGLDTFAAEQISKEAAVATAPRDAGFLSKMGNLVGGFMGSALSKIDLSGVKLDGLSAPLDPASTKPSDAKENEDVTKGMTDDERARYDKLTPEERAQYNELYRAAGKNETAQAEVKKLLNEGKLEAYMAVAGKADAEGKKNLQKLLFNGTLLQGEQGKALLDVLSEFASGEGATTPQGVDRGELINQVLKDVADPSNASRQPDGDRHCGLLSILGAAARNDPAGYAALMTQLAEKGSVTLTDAKGNQITLNYKGPPDKNSKLSLTQQLFVKTLEDFSQKLKAGGGLMDALMGAMQKFSGISARDLADFKEALWKEFGADADYEPMTVPDQEEAEAKATEQLKKELGRDPTPEEVQARAKEIRDKATADGKKLLDEQLAAGEQVQVEVNGPPPHWVTVTNHFVLELPGGGKMEFYVVDDGSGKPQLMSPDELQNETGAVIYNADVSQPPEGSYDPDDDDPGIGFNRGGGGGDTGG